MSTQPREWDQGRDGAPSPGLRSVRQRIANVLKPEALPPAERTPLPAKGGLKGPTKTEAIFGMILPRNLSDNKPVSAAARKREQAAREEQTKALADARAEAKNDPLLGPLTHWSEDRWLREVHTRETRAFGKRVGFERIAYGQETDAMIDGIQHAIDEQRGYGSNTRPYHIDEAASLPPRFSKGGRPPKEVPRVVRIAAKKLELAQKRAAEDRAAAAVRPQGPVGQGGVTDEAWKCYLLTKPPAGVGLLSIDNAGAKLGISKRKAQANLEKVRRAFQWERNRRQ